MLPEINNRIDATLDMLQTTPNPYCDSISIQMDNDEELLVLPSPIYLPQSLQQDHL